MTINHVCLSMDKFLAGTSSPFLWRRHPATRVAAWECRLASRVALSPRRFTRFREFHCPLLRGSVAFELANHRDRGIGQFASVSCDFRRTNSAV